MFKEKLENLRNKFTERANTLFTSMKDDKEKEYGVKKESKIKGLGITNDENEGELSALVDKETKKKYDTSPKKEEIKTKILEEEKDSKRADLLYPTMKDKEEKKEENLDKIDIKKKEEEKTKNEQEKSLEKDLRKGQIEKTDKKEEKLTNGASDIKIKRSLRDVDLNDNDYEVFGNTISPKNKKEDIEIINNVKFPKDTGNEKIEKLKKEAKETRSERLRENNEFYLKSHPKTYHKQIIVDNIENPIIKSSVEKIKGNESVENLHMSKTKSYLDTDYAKQHKIYNNYNEAPIELKEYFKNKISEQIGKDKLDKTKGIFIDANTETTKFLKENLLSNENFLKKLRAYSKALSNNYSVNDSIQFTGKNWGNAIGRADIRDMHINKNGDIELYIADVYDFNEGETSDLVRVGRNRQDKGEITPYFYAYRVIIPKDELRKN